MNPKSSSKNKRNILNFQLRLLIWQNIFCEIIILFTKTSLNWLTIIEWLYLLLCPTDGQTSLQAARQIHFIMEWNRRKNIETDKQQMYWLSDRKTNRQTVEYTGRKTDKQTNGQKDIEADRQTTRQAWRKRDRKQVLVLKNGRRSERSNLSQKVHTPKWHLSITWRSTNRQTDKQVNRN